MAVELVFLEFVDQAQDWLTHIKNKGISASDFTVISFHPKVKAFLKQQGIDCRESFEFCDTTAHGKLLEVLQGWTDAMRSTLSLEDENGVRESYIENLIFAVRAALSVWLYRTHVCIRVIKELHPQRVWVVEELSLSIVSSRLTEASERYLGDICRQRQDVVVERISPTHAPAKTVMRRSRWMLLAHRLVGFLSMWNLCRRGRKQIVALVNSHNMDSLLEDLSQSLAPDYECVFLGNRRRGTPLSVIWHDMMNARASYRFLHYPLDIRVKESSVFIHGKNQLAKDFERLTKTWSYENVSPATWINHKYRGSFEETILNCSYFQSRALTHLWRKNKPWLVISQHARGLTAIAGEVCRIQNIPSLMVPHGSFTPLRNPQSALEWRENALGMINTPYEYVALQTPLTEGFINDLSIKSKTIITGPLIIGRPIATNQAQQNLRKKLAPNGEKIILHASTPKHRQGQRFLNYETIDEYVQAMADLITAVDTLKGYKLILRFRPVDELTTDELKSLLPQSSSSCIASDGNFNDYLAVADLLVSFSSTTMEEALLNNVAVLQYDKFNRYEHIPGVLISVGRPWPGVSGVYTVRSQEDLAFALESIKINHLNDHKTFPVVSYRYDRKKCVALDQWIKQLGASS